MSSVAVGVASGTTSSPGLSGPWKVLGKVAFPLTFLTWKGEAPGSEKVLESDKALCRKRSGKVQKFTHHYVCHPYQWSDQGGSPGGKKVSHQQKLHTIRCSGSCSPMHA